MKNTILLILSLTLLFSCNLTPKEESAKISLTPIIELNSRAGSRTITSMTLTVTAEDIDTITTSSITESISIKIPFGSSRKFLLNVKLSDGSVLTGETVVDLEKEEEIVTIVVTEILLTSFKILKIDNPGLLTDIEGKITGKTVHIELPKQSSDGTTPINLDELIITATVDSVESKLFTTNSKLEVEARGETISYTVQSFRTFTPLLNALVTLGTAPASMEPGLDYINGTAYISYADSNDKAVLKSYDPTTGILSEGNLFNHTTPAPFPRFFKVSGTSANDLYLTYLSDSAANKVFVYHFNGTSWSLVTSADISIDRPDVSITTNNNNIYVGFILTSGPNPEYNILKFDPSNPGSGFTTLAAIPDSSTACATNSLFIENESSIFISIKDPMNMLKNFYFDGTVWHKTTPYSNFMSSTHNADYIYSNNMINGELLIDVRPDSGDYFTFAVRKNTDEPWKLSYTGIRDMTRSFYDGTDVYRTVFTNSSTYLQKLDMITYEWDPAIWTIPDNNAGKSKVKTIFNSSDIFTTYISGGNIFFIHSKK